MMKLPASDYIRRQFITLGQISIEDLRLINSCRTDQTRLGFAYQLTYVRLFNRFPMQKPLETNEEILAFIAAQLQIELEAINQYDHRRETVAKHQAMIADYLSLKPFNSIAERDIAQFIFDEALRLEQPSILTAKAREFLKVNKILEPASSTLQRLIHQQRAAARTFIYDKITQSLSDEQKSALDTLLVTGDKSQSTLQRLKEPPGRPSPGALVRLTQKLEQIDQTGVLTIDLGWLNNNYQLRLARYARHYSVYRLRNLKAARRYAVLLSFLHQLYRNTIDEMIDMYDKLINKVHKRAASDLDMHMRAQRKQVFTSLLHYREFGGILLDETIPDTLIRQMIFEKVQRETLRTEIEEVDAYLTGKHAHPFKLVVSRYSYLRQFIPALLKFLKLDPEVESSTDLIQAMQLLIRMNAEDKRKLPEDTPVSFIPKRIQALVIEDGQPQRAAWECALITSIRDEIKSGNLSVKKSKQFGNLESFFMPYDQWKKQRETFFARSGLPLNPQDVREYLTQRLDAAYDRFLKQLPENNHLKIHEDGWRLATDKAEALDNKTESSLKQFKEWLADKMCVIKLPELLIEVDNELHFTRYFMAPAKQTPANAEDICAVLATIMAHGCNIGTYTMSHLTDDISYPRIKQITDWMLTDEAQRSALAQVVNAIGNIEVTKAWGHGQTSSSDGQRFAFRRKVLQQTYSASFNDFAIEFYSFVADNYAPFYSLPVECTDRDAPYVLDGLLYNESDLPLKEHYTDTHGYTENNFAAFAMLGRRFSPRIRGLHKQRIYRINRDRDYGPLESIVSRSNRTVHLNWIIEQWDRIGHFYASLESGHTTASTAMKRLNGFSGKNHFYRANRELGRIFKTEHILEYMSDQSLRQRTRRGLLKSEQIHALARDLNYGKRGRISNRDWSEQQTSSSCLTLIIACIIFWQAREINRVIETSGNPDLSSLEHISPVSWDNVILYGEYVLDRNLVKI